jgi:hypothetical protein
MRYLASIFESKVLISIVSYSNIITKRLYEMESHITIFIAQLLCIHAGIVPFLDHSDQIIGCDKQCIAFIQKVSPVRQRL